MSTTDFRAYLDPNRVLPLTTRRMSFSDHPAPLDRLLGVWGALSQEPFKGITTDGVVTEGVFGWKPSGAPVAEAANAASAFLAALSPEVRQQVSFPLDSALRRHWQNTPILLREPQVELGELGQRERDLALELIKVSLSPEGHARAQRVMANNRFMGELIGATNILHEWAFALSIFGAPSANEPWGWQFFGHHLALNCLFADSQMVLSPVFMGLEPDHEEGPHQRRMFEPHESLALGLMRSLSEPEREAAVLYRSMLTEDQPKGRYDPDDGHQVGGAFRDNRVVPFEGVRVGALSRKQKSQIMGLAELFIQELPAGPRDTRFSEIEKYLNESHLAWIGPVDEVNPFYFRIHSPVVLIEFDHHSGIFLANQDPARFHVHSIVRTPNGGDYGVDLLRHHYLEGGHDRTPAHGHRSALGTHSHDGGRTYHQHD